MTSTAEKSVAVKGGDLVLLDFEMWAEAGGRTELVDTTRAEAAQKAEIKLEEGQKFEARPHIVGGDFFPAAIETALVGAKVGEEIEREFAPGDAFGERDPKLIELFSMHEIERLPEMRRDDAHLDIGTRLTIRGRRGRVASLTAARVRVDFNPPFAGRKIRAKFKVERQLTETPEKVRGLLDLVYGRGEEFKVESHSGALSIHVPERAKFDIGWFAAKPRAIERIRSQLKPASIKFVEEYVTPPAKEKDGGASPPAETPSTPAPTPTKHSAKTSGSPAE